MSNLSFKSVLIEEGVLKYVLAGKILEGLTGTPIQSVSKGSSRKPSEAPNMGKDTLHLLSFKGEFLKPCPGTRAYICCGYQILNVGTNCPLDCSYCILQSYFNQPNIRLFVNLPQAIAGVCQVIDENPDVIFRVGTGEFTDSLALDHITGWSKLLVPLFAKRKNAILELKTKTTQIQQLIELEYRDRVIVSWSLNSPYIVAREEHKSASLKKRLEAARKCQEEGFALGFHFDPLIAHTQWKDEYLKTLELLDEYVDPKGIIWISLGSFRFIPALKPIIRQRHPNSCVLDGEFVRGLDGKMRYFKPIRIDLYAFMREALDEWYKSLGLYLCMESDEVWQKSLGWTPKDSTGLRRYLDGRVVEFFE